MVVTSPPQNKYRKLINLCTLLFALFGANKKRSAVPLSQNKQDSIQRAPKTTIIQIEINEHRASKQKWRERNGAR